MPESTRSRLGSALLWVCSFVACGSPAPSADGDVGANGGTGGSASGGTNSGGTASGGQTPSGGSGGNGSGGSSSGGTIGAGGTGGYIGGVYPENCLASCQARSDGDCLSVEFEACQGGCGKPTYFGDQNACAVLMEDHYACLLLFDACIAPEECSDENALVVDRCLGKP